MAKVAFHMAEPIKVNKIKLFTFILAKPAGIEIKWRIPGINRPIKVEVSPFLMNIFLSVFNLFGGHKKQWGNLVSANA
jgi:hypothetical protein